MSDKLHVKTGNRKEHSLSPKLFNIALEMIIKETQKNYEGLNIGRKCGILTHVDDVIIIR